MVVGPISDAVFALKEPSNDDENHILATIIWSNKAIHHP